MPEMNLNQITNKLNGLFAGDSRKLVFWYDTNAEFVDEIDTLGLANASVLRLEPDNQFYVKYYLECEDTAGNYLVYAPFAKPGIRDNHLWDTIKYSTEFFADRASLLRVDLGIPENLKPVIQKHIKFFGNKERAEKFYKCEITHYTRSGIEVALMSVLCKLKAPSFDEVARAVLCDDTDGENKYLAEFAKYELVESFWTHCEQNFAYVADAPSVKKLILTLFVTYAAKSIRADLPKEWNPLISAKSGNIVVFLENMMNNVLYQERFDALSDSVAQELQVQKVLYALPIENIVDCDCFACLDDMLIDWMAERLADENTVAKLNGKSIGEIAAERTYTHFGAKQSDTYQMLILADKLLALAGYRCEGDCAAIMKQYQSADFQIDTNYRKFYLYLDRLPAPERFEALRQLVENTYTNKYLNVQSAAWNDALTDYDLFKANCQHRFYSRFVSAGGRSKTVVIISDALRYEVAAELADRLRGNENCAEVTRKAMIGVLPSITKLGMPSLLPHKNLEVSDELNVTVDGLPCDDTRQREAILKKDDPTSRCFQFDAIRNLSHDATYNLFKGTGVYYIYHNQVDTRGDKPNTENEVFVACEEAIQEIYDFIIKLARNKIATHYIITADHGFLYKRDKLQESDKISLKEGVLSLGKRYALAGRASEIEGVRNFPFGHFIGAYKDKRVVSTPLGSDIFKSPGGGSNYVHGGSSPQELLVPVVEATTRTGRLKKEIQAAPIALVSLLNKVTNLIAAVEFIQSEPVSDTVKPATYHASFVDAEGNAISNEGLIAADKADSDSTKRIFRVKFRFKDMSYDRAAKYYLTVYAADDDITPVIKREIRIDMAFSADFGF
ncbi:MAG: BREX-1 system phosphatase PglZ type A [Gracilibacteraceae bacterium]|nr:BREX-1 system phosphatase PglZ type A [Gracilibacteraceae bacterium]